MSLDAMPQPVLHFHLSLRLQNDQNYWNGCRLPHLVMLYANRIAHDQNC